MNDDYLDSAWNIEEAIRWATAVKEALKEGDFHLGHWVANNSRVLEAIKPPELDKKTQNAAVNLGEDDPEMLLGVHVSTSNRLDGVLSEGGLRALHPTRPSL